MTTHYPEGTPLDVGLTPYEFLQKLLNTERVTTGLIHEALQFQCTPHLVVSRIHLTLPPLVNGKLDKPDIVYDEQSAWRAYEAGSAICNFIDMHLAQDHPMDKRFLLRYMEYLCIHYNKREDRSTGFGHDIIYSREPIGDFYPNFDNTLYIPPLTGYWAIAAKGSARD